MSLNSSIQSALDTINQQINALLDAKQALEAVIATPIRQDEEQKARPVKQTKKKTNKLPGGKTTKQFVIEALNLLGPSNTERIIEELVKMGWTTESRNPHAVVYQLLYMMKRNGEVTNENGVWAIFSFPINVEQMSSEDDLVV